MYLKFNTGEMIVIKPIDFLELNSVTITNLLGEHSNLLLTGEELSQLYNELGEYLEKVK